ncbi:hypothetical protein Tco_0215660 [Tanacetum coccineum]
MSTPMATKRLDADLQGTPTDQMTDRRMIGGLMYLTASQPDIAFATFVCARYQERPTVKRPQEVNGSSWWKARELEFKEQDCTGDVLLQMLNIVFIVCHGCTQVILDAYSTA